MCSIGPADGSQSNHHSATQRIVWYDQHTALNCGSIGFGKQQSHQSGNCCALLTWVCQIRHMQCRVMFGLVFNVRCRCVCGPSVPYTPTRPTQTMLTWILARTFSVRFQLSRCLHPGTSQWRVGDGNTLKESARGIGNSMFLDSTCWQG